MKTSISFLRTAIFGGCLLLPSLLFAQQQPDQPEEKQPQTEQKEPGQEQQKQGEEQKQALQMEKNQQAAQVLTPLIDFDRSGITAALMANARGESPAVRRLAGNMARDHLATTRKILNHVLKNKIELQLGAESEEIQELRTAQGPDLDRKYVDMVISTHQKQIEDLTAQIEQVKDRPLRTLLNQTKQSMQAHLKQAEKVRRQIQGMAAR